MIHRSGNLFIHCQPIRQPMRLNSWVSRRTPGSQKTKQPEFPSKPLSESPGMRTTGPRNSMTAENRRCCSRLNYENLSNGEELYLPVDESANVHQEER